ncbi:hypothetical protein, partial [Thiolapillus sp.]
RKVSIAMKIVTGVTAIAAIVTIAAYFGIKPEQAEAEQPTFNLEGGNGSGNVQIQNSGSINIDVNSSQSSSVLKCKKENLYITKSGFYGAVNPEIYSQMENALQAKDQKTLEKLLFEGLVIKVPSGVSACVKAIAFNWYRKQILLPGRQITYWVPDRAIEKVD